MNIKLYCICCEKEINTIQDGSCLDDAGYLYIEFGYGSRHDQGHGFHDFTEKPSSDSLRDRLLACKQIMGHICDDCFEAKLELLQGFDLVKRPSERKRVV